MSIVRSWSLVAVLALAWSPAASGEEPPWPGALPIAYAMPRDAELSLGVFDQDGRLLRQVLKAEPRPAGARTEWWDGRDQYGQPIPAGSYQARALYHDPISTEWALTLGNPGTPAWPTADNTGDWLSDEALPQAAVSDGSWVYLAAPGSELGWSVIAVDERGQRRWGVCVMIYPRAVSLALHGDLLYVLYSGPEKTGAAKPGEPAIRGRALLMCLDRRTGAAANFTKASPRLTIATFPYADRQIPLWDLRNRKAFDPEVYSGQPRYADLNLGESTEAIGLAATSTTVYVAMHDAGMLEAFDAQTAARRPADDIPLQRPVGLQALSDDALLAVSAGKVVRIDLATRAVTPLITAGLAAPHSLALDKQGRIYVSDWKDSFQVKVFTPEGKPLRAIGKPGGRPWLGRWDPDGMLLPRGIAVTDDGHLWVAEEDDSPKRISVWNAATGAFVRDYLGPTHYGGGSIFWVDPADQSIAHTMCARFKLDWQRRSFRPLAIEMRRGSRDQPFLQNTHAGLGVRSLRRNGTDYVAFAYGNLVVVCMRSGEILVPVAACGGLQRTMTDDGTGHNGWDSDIGHHLFKDYWPECFRGHRGDNFAWSDRNGDGLVQAEEMTWVPTQSRGDAYIDGRQPEFSALWGASMGPDWCLAFGGFCADRSALLRLEPSGWTAGGAPLYDIAQARAVAVRATGFDGLYASDDGRVYASGRDLAWYQRNPPYPTPRADALTCFDHDGRMLWSLATPDEQGRKDVMASSPIGEFHLPGIGSVIGTWQWWGNYRPYLVAADGLFVGTTLDEMMIGPAGRWAESFNFFYQAPDGTPYLINGGNDAHHILRLRGLDRGGRFEQPLVLSEADVARAAASPQPTAAGNGAGKPALAVRWLDRAPGVDGELGDWDMGYGVSVGAATVALGRDAAKLYLAYHVPDDSPLRNQGSDWMTLFTSGDAVDLMLGTDAKADPHRGAAVAGDLRLLFSVFQDRPIAVLYRPVAPGAKPVQLMAARFDRIERLAEATVAFRRGAGFYDLEAAVPLAALGLGGGETLRGDVGIIASDPAGRSRIARTYHYNRRTQMVSDLTTEATLQPGDWGDLHLPLGRNLLTDGGFEGALGGDGWAVQAGQRGGTAAGVGEAAHSGQHGLLLRGGGVAVAQTAPVVAGGKYSLRFHYRGTGMKGAAFSASITWQGGKLENADLANGQAMFHGLGNASHLPILELRTDTEGWTRCFDERLPNWFAPRAYVAPAGATAATVTFSLAGSGERTAICIDDVELIAEAAD